MVILLEASSGAGCGSFRICAMPEHATLCAEYRANSAACARVFGRGLWTGDAVGVSCSGGAESSK